MHYLSFKRALQSVFCFCEMLLVSVTHNHTHIICFLKTVKVGHLKLCWVSSENHCQLMNTNNRSAPPCGLHLMNSLSLAAKECVLNQEGGSGATLVSIKHAFPVNLPKPDSHSCLLTLLTDWSCENLVIMWITQVLMTNGLLPANTVNGYEVNRKSPLHKE